MQVAFCQSALLYFKLLSVSAFFCMAIFLRACIGSTMPPWLINYEESRVA